MEQNKKTKGLVLYTDGGCIQDIGRSGYGCHGYLYTTEEDTKKRPSYPDKHLTTNKGYLIKQNVTDLEPTGEQCKVFPECYFELYGNLSTSTSNNQAELDAVLCSIKEIHKELLPNVFDEIDHIHVCTDSQYVIRGFTTWLASWEKNNWRKPDGGVVANRGHWEDFIKLREKLTEAKIGFTMEYVKGHSDNLGNAFADLLATMGRDDKQRDTHHKFLWDIDYFKQCVDLHPMMNFKFTYTGSNKHLLDDGLYYVSNPFKVKEKQSDEEDIEIEVGEDTTLCRIVSNTMYGVVQPVFKEDTMLEQVFNFIRKSSEGVNALVSINLVNLYRKDISRYVSIFKDVSLKSELSKGFLDITFLSEQQKIAREIFPASKTLACVDMIDVLCELRGNVHDHIDNKDTPTNIQISEVTENFYTPVPNKEGKVVFHKDLGVGKVRVPVSVDIDKLKLAKDNININVSMGTDILTRNLLKKLEKSNPKVYLICEKISNASLRYFLYVQSEQGNGLYCDYYGNTLYVVDKKQS